LVDHGEQWQNHLRRRDLDLRHIDGSYTRKKIRIMGAAGKKLGDIPETSHLTRELLCGGAEIFDQSYVERDWCREARGSRFS